MDSEADRTAEETEDAAAAAHLSQPTWLKRLSTFSSIDSSLPSSPRPGSAAVSQSNGSIAFSATDSTSPMFTSLATPPPLPNRLVKRTSSVRSTKSSSRLPIPTLRRPATSHQRDATTKGRKANIWGSVSTESPEVSAPAPSEHWRCYFTPKSASDPASSTWRRHSTSIPTPIKRITPDRKYRPVLLSARDSVAPPTVEVDDDDDDESVPDIVPLKRSSTVGRVSRRFFSSPLPGKTAFDPMPSGAEDLSKRQPSLEKYSLPHIDHSGTSTATQKVKTSRHSLSGVPTELSVSRSFSPSDLIPADPPKWKRPSADRLPDNKYRRRGDRGASKPEKSMGSRQSVAVGENERPSKRRDASNSSMPRRTSAARPDQSIRTASNTLKDVQTHHASPPGHVPTVPVSRTSSIRKTSDHSAPLQEAHILPSFASTMSSSRPSEVSGYSSTLAGSDGDVRPGDDDDSDGQSDNIYSSVRTRATSAGSAFALEKIFDDSRRNKADNKPTELGSYLQNSPFIKGDLFGKPRHSAIEEEDVVSTPVRSNHNGPAASSPVFRFGESRPQQPITSSPPELPHDLKTWPAAMSEDDEEGSWSFDVIEEEGGGTLQHSHQQLPTRSRFPHIDLTSNRLSPHTFSHGSSSIKSTPQRDGSGIANGFDTETRSSIFDWSEQQPLDKSPNNRSPPRPKTVHGKKDTENRGSRSVGRRAPSGIHVRSQSVPVAQEADGKRSQVVTNKFGTWGVGSKGVSEDWNEDFDFEEPVPPLPTEEELEEKRFDSGMFVPKAIREQQQNVLANIGLLRDWGLLIEELKDLKTRAAALKLLNGEHMDMWNEVDAMVDLADQESEDRTLAPRNSPPSSPTFDYDAFDEPLSIGTPRPSTLPTRAALDDDVFDVFLPSPSPKKGDDVPFTPRRPRKDSEAVAKSIIEALQQKRNVSDPTHGGLADQPAKKVPFDTATLRRIVPHVQELRDKVKKTLREAEGLYISPQERNSDTDPSFSRIFREPAESPSGRRKTRRSLAATDRVLSDDSQSRSPDDLTARLKLMTVV